ncbi:NAD(P)-dependent oxidoreductase [Qipengyuania spongiae]|uniref:NAD(P)H-binding protein n=1 Tax=Qipengyuania spongiae TaxID=2909673 RepID=A0ABY5T3M9_9SPHN|nr:NAD(P)H-binding protein [Qipengyuania spongiae]UVI40179.1 NAD(P)H-binding protein [Qipengyuania spongiae]
MEAEPVTDAAPLAVFGAGGKTGTEILRHAVRKGIAVRAFEHTLPEPSDRVDNVEYFQCDVLNDDFSSELEGCRAVISALGIGFSPSTTIDPPPLYTEGTRRLVEAMSTTGISQIVVISAAFVEPQPSVPAWFELTARPALHNILEQMRAWKIFWSARKA